MTLTMSDITLNAADTLPAVWQYFVPTWYQALSGALPRAGRRCGEHGWGRGCQEKEKIIFGSCECFTQVEHLPFYVAARSLARLPLNGVPAASCGPGTPGPYAKRPPFDKGGFFFLAHFFIFFAFLEYFSIVLHKLVVFPVPIIL